MAWKESILLKSHPNFALACAHAVLRLLQLVLGLAVCGLYGQDLNNARLHGLYADKNFVFAVVVGGLSAITALILVIGKIRAIYYLFAWEIILFILWTAVFGLFGKMWINEDPEGNEGAIRMKRAVWVDLVNMLLWLLTALYGVFSFLKRGRASLHTGRADV